MSDKIEIKDPFVAAAVMNMQEQIDQLSAALRAAEERNERMMKALTMIGSCRCQIGSGCSGRYQCIVCVAKDALKGPTNAK